MMILSNTKYYAYRRDYLQFFSNVFYNLDYDFGRFKVDSATQDFNILKDCLFVVKDLFLKNFKNV